MTSTDPRPVILVAIDWYLPAFKAGGPIRSIANLVEALGDAIDFRIVCGNRDLGSNSDLEVPMGHWTPQGKAQVLYLTQAECTVARWASIIDEVRPEKLYLNSLYSGPFSRLPWKVARHLGLATTLAPRGMLGPGALAIKPWRKRLWLTWQQWTGRYDALTWHGSTEQEAEEIRRWFPSAKVQVALNLPVPFNPLPPPEDKGELILLSVGRIHPIKNYALGVDLARNLAQSGRKVTYRIIGPIEDQEEHRRLEARGNGIQLEFMGPMAPAEIRKTFAAAHLVLVPSLNENFGHAVAEAISAARPVIVSDRTVWTTLPGGPTVSCVPLDITEWAAAAHRLLALSPGDILEQSRAAHQRCLLSETHLRAQRDLFEA